MTRRSTSGWLCSLFGTPISYASRTKATMTLSSAEAEVMALSSGMAESLHLQQLIEELQTWVVQPSATPTTTSVSSSTQTLPQLLLQRRA